MTHQVAIACGDGIGPEIAHATQRVLEAAGARIDWVETPVGAIAEKQLGSPLPVGSLDRMRQIGVILKSPLVAERCSGGVTVGANHYPSVNNGLRRELNSFANVRPVIGFPGISGAYQDLDIVIMREVTEDTYAGIERQVDPDTAEATKLITRGASERIARYAFEYARRMGRRKVAAIHKANVLHLTDGLFLRSVRDVSAAYPDIEFDDKMIDATCYLLIKNPKIFDVLVLPNQYGDIVSDLAAGLVGSLGLAPGANIGPDTAMFEAAHGAAPDIAGQNIANPTGLILSGAMMLDHLGEFDAAARVRRAVRTILGRAESLTPDLGGTATTTTFTGALCAAVQDS